MVVRQGNLCPFRQWDTKKNEARRLAAFNRELERGTDEHWTLADDLPKNY